MAAKEDESVDLFECAVCLRCMLDRVPRFLHCHHTFCEECIAQLKQDRKIACPTCKETTYMKSNDVKELSANFMLSKVKEVITNIPKVRAVSKCQVCIAKKATFLCVTCLLPLCLPCKASHAASGLESHDVLHLCEKHQEVISHICMKCITPLCVTCMLHGHQDHKTDFVKYSEGVTKMQSELQVLLTEMQITLLKVDPFLQSAKKMDTLTSTIKEQLWSHRAYYLDKLAEVNGLISSIDTNSFAYDDIKLLCMQSKDMCNRISQELDSSIKDKTEICNKYQGIKEQSCNAVKNLKFLVDRKLYMPQFRVEPLPSNVIVTPGKIDTVNKQKVIVDGCSGTPVLSMPESQKSKPMYLRDEVEVTTDEEGYKVMFTARTKLYRFTEKQWKERGLGDIKILYSSEKQHARLIMRRELVYKVCLDHYIKKDMEIQFRSGTEQNILVWGAVDYSDETPAMYAFNAKFKNEDIASELKKKLEDVQALLPTGWPEKTKKSDDKATKKANTIKSLFKQDASSTPASDLLKNISGNATGDNNTKVNVGGLSFPGTPVLTTPEPQKPKPELPKETEKPN